MSNGPNSTVLLVADAPGHIQDRIGRGWVAHAQGTRFDLVCSSRTHPFPCLWRGARRGLIHWLDTQRFMACATASTVPQIATIHHILEPDLARTIPRLAHADALTATSKRWQIKLEHLTDRVVWHLPYTINTDLFRDPPDRAALRQAAGISKDTFILGFVGKAEADVNGRKGIDLLLEVLGAVRAEHQDILLALIGPGWDPLAKKVEALGVRVLRQEFKDTVMTVSAYGLMDVLLVTSSEEGGPCTILEAMATNVAVITSDVGHVPEVVADGVTGFVCPRRTAGEFRETISALRRDHALKQRIVAAAREFVVRERDDRVVIPKINFEEIYQHAGLHYRRRRAPERFVRRLPQALFAARFPFSFLRNLILPR